MSKEWVFLDFDGVVCDSLEECFQTSGLLLNFPQDDWDFLADQHPPLIDFGEEYKERFRRVRPYIRSGEDYIVVHRLLQQNKEPKSQKEFDAALDQEGQVSLAFYKKRLYVLRESLLSRQAELWMTWNPLYPGVAEALKSVLKEPRVVILSTKKAEFIAAILKFHGVAWPAERIFYTNGRAKLAIVDEVAGRSASTLIDDQIDHLDFSHPSCRCRLALWGYASKEAREKHVPAWTLEEALAFLHSL
jgi:phosphoglycolate phosphatase-like HAD superfamily hydrolase